MSDSGKMRGVALMVEDGPAPPGGKGSPENPPTNTDAAGRETASSTAKVERIRRRRQLALLEATDTQSANADGASAAPSSAESGSVPPAGEERNQGGAAAGNRAALSRSVRLSRRAARLAARDAATERVASDNGSGKTLAKSDADHQESRAPRLRQPAKGDAVELPYAMYLASLPKRGRKRSHTGLLSFLICVALPTALVAIYFFCYASNQYAAGFRYTVRDAQMAASGLSSGAAGGGMASFVGMSSTPNPTENYMVADYVGSREAVDELQKRIDIISRYSSPDIDWWARFNKIRPIERFVSYWHRMMSASYDQVTGLGSVEVRAFTAEDAYLIANTLARMSEVLINNIAMRPQQDAVVFAEGELKKAETRLENARNQITQFRNDEMLIDPQSSVVTSNVLTAQTLRANLTQLQTEFGSLRSQQLSANSSIAASLQARIKATKEQLVKVEAEVANARGLGANNPLSKVVAKYEQLEFERQFAQNLTMSAMQSLVQAKANAIQQHVYVTPFVKPALPQSSTYPARLLSIGVAAFGFFLVWLVGLLLIRSLREHLT
jgi:capsular polysaccharide transport system permease protein